MGVTINRFSQDLQLIDMELPVSALNTFASMTSSATLSNFTTKSFLQHLFCVSHK